MPIYAYRCSECDFSQDILQKIADPVLTVCPSCGKSSFKKQVTAAGFQLKGSGWYVTDFRDGKSKDSNVASATSETPKNVSEQGAPFDGASSNTDSGPSTTKSASTTESPKTQATGPTPNASTR